MRANLTGAKNRALSQIWGGHSIPKVGSCRHLNPSSAHPNINSGLLSPSSAPTQLRAAGAQL